MMQFKISKVSLTDVVVAKFLEETLTQRERSLTVPGKVLLHPTSVIVGCRRHLTLRHDRKGYFVLVGGKGHDKRYLGICEKLTFEDGVAPIFEFILRDQLSREDLALADSTVSA